MLRPRHRLVGLVACLGLGTACTDRATGDDAGTAGSTTTGATTPSGGAGTGTTAMSGSSSSTTTSATTTGTGSSSDASSSTGLSEDKWTGRCEASLFTGPQWASIELEGWPTVEGDLDLQTTCTMSAQTEGTQWVASLWCLDPSDGSMRPLDLRSRLPDGRPDLRAFVDEPVTVDLFYEAGFPYSWIEWLRIADATDLTLYGLADSRVSPWAEVQPRAFPEATVAPVDLGCVHDPGELNDRDIAIGFEFSVGEQTEVLAAFEPTEFGPHLVQIYGAVDRGPVCVTPCLELQFGVLPMP